VKGFVRVAVEEGLDGSIVPVCPFGDSQVGHRCTAGIEDSSDSFCWASSSCYQQWHQSYNEQIPGLILLQSFGCLPKSLTSFDQLA
jgi:hypothetical protein